MKAKNLCLYAGLCAGFAATAVAGDKPELKRLDNGIKVEPVRVAKARMENGMPVRVSDWIEHQGGNGQRGASDAQVFDCFGDSDGDGFMDDTGGCGQSTGRWFFGTAYCNGLATNDMYDVAANEAVGYGRADFAWQWTCAGFGTEQCVIGVFTQESDPDACEANTFDYSGWLLDFGVQSCNPGGYYYSNVDIFNDFGGITWPAVADGDGSYNVIYLTDSGASLATCAQPMLWGAGNNTGGPVGGPGAQDTGQMDDDNLLDGTNTVPTECYTYSYGVCPDPLGSMLQFWGEPEDNACGYADFNGNGTVNTQDFTAFLNAWVAQNSSADCNGNGTVNTQDFTCFLNLWVPCSN